jgi:hypothetical protein
MRESLSPIYEAKELYNERYRKLMEDAGIAIPMIFRQTTTPLPPSNG